MPRSFVDAQRGSATGIMNGLLALVVGAAMFWILSEINPPTTNRALNSTSNQTLNTATGWFETFLGWWPLLVLLLFVFSLIALVVFQREFLR